MSETDIKYYTLEAATAIPAGGIATAALRFCAICDVAVETMGGPGCGSLCPDCATLIRTGRIKIDRADVEAAIAEVT